jgi:hypothetical protein
MSASDGRRKSVNNGCPFSSWCTSLTSTSAIEYLIGLDGSSNSSYAFGALYALIVTRYAYISPHIHTVAQKKIPIGYVHPARRIRTNRCYRHAKLKHSILRLEAVMQRLHVFQEECIYIPQTRNIVNDHTVVGVLQCCIECVLRHIRGQYIPEAIVIPNQSKLRVDVLKNIENQVKKQSRH